MPRDVLRRVVTNAASLARQWNRPPRRPSRLAARVTLGLLLLLGQRPSAGQAPAADGVQLLVARLQQALDREDPAAFAALFASGVPETLITEHRDEMMRPGATRRVVRERDRVALETTATGERSRIVVEVFEETAGRARVVTSGLVLRRPPEGGVDSWQVVEAAGLSAVQGLYRVRLDTSSQYAVRNLSIVAPDLVLTLVDGSVFVLHSDDGVTGAVLLGRGEMRFSPASDTERGQLRLFDGAETLVSRFDSAFIRFHPADYARLIPADGLRRVAVDARAARRATEVVEREISKTYSVDVRDVSSDSWHLLPREDDFLAEIRTDGHGTLTYSRFGAQPEDISLTRRDRRLTIALYPSADKLASQGRHYSDELQRDYDVVDYDIDASVSPGRRFLRARARLTIRARMSITTVTLRLADALAVSSITSADAGPLGFIRLRNQNAIFVRLPRVLLPGAALTLSVTYSGLVVSQALENDSLQGTPVPVMQDPEPHLLQSTASLWYPQNSFTDYATATVRIAVPQGYACVASGEQVAAPVDAAPAAASETARTFVFRANQPLRYLAFVVSRFARVDRRMIALGGDASRGVPPAQLTMTVDSNPLQRVRAREVLAPMEDILRFYAGLLGDAPYPSTALAMVEADLPGGHSPAYFVMLNSPLTTSGLVWQNDPAAFQGFPEFFIAHELAHQWWGQAVGWKNYHDQWISEGFAQYFAALYAHHARGDRVFHDMLRQFRRWSIAESDKGPVFLGQRLGQIQGGQRVFRALVYNKGAAVLHMLRRAVGDEAFFEGLRRFYQDHKFQTAGTDDLRLALERESGLPLERFFERWVYGTALPRVAHRSSIATDQVTVRLSQLNDALYDIPVTVSLVHADGSVEDVVVVMTEKEVERRIPTVTRVREVQINRDFAALAEFATD